MPRPAQGGVRGKHEAAGPKGTNSGGVSCHLDVSNATAFLYLHYKTFKKTDCMSSFEEPHNMLNSMSRKA